MAIKSSNVAARVEPDVKAKAEEILSKPGISETDTSVKILAVIYVGRD